jgi:hypothetical protein
LENKENYNFRNLRASTRKRDLPFQEMSCSQLSTCEKIRKNKGPVKEVEIENQNMKDLWLLKSDKSDSHVMKKAASC